MGVFTQRFEALFRCAGTLGCMVFFAPLPFLPVYLCANVGPQGLLAVTLPVPLIPQSAMSLGPALPVYLCVNVVSGCLLAVVLPAPRTACSVCPTILHVSGSGHVAMNPVPPSCPSLPLLPVWMNVSSSSPWLSDFRVVRFSVSSGCFLLLNCCPFGCARRHSGSTYASILVFSVISHSFSCS